MKDLTFGWLNENIAFILALGGGLFALYTAIKKAFEAGLKPVIEKIETVEHSLKDEMKKIDMNATKNFLVAQIDEVERGQTLDAITLERFWEQYEHYIKDLEGNTYIKKRVEALQKNGKL